MNAWDRRVNNDQSLADVAYERLAEIATALERIADALERERPTPQQAEDKQFERSREALIRSPFLTYREAVDRP